jgi:WD40 repeat protein
MHGPTERYIAPASLLFTPDGRHFLAGADSLIATFDVSRNGEGPSVERKTNASTRGRKGDVSTGMGMKGIVSALSISSDNILGAGTFTRNIALYANAGQGEQIAVFPLTQDMGKEDETYIGGSGVTDVRWSPCGKYLYVAERQGSGVHVYDVRVAGRRIGVLTGRRAETTQRIGLDVVVDAGGSRKHEAHQSDEGDAAASAAVSSEREAEDDLEAARQRAISLASLHDSSSHDLEAPRYEDEDDTADRTWRNARSSPTYDFYVETSQPSYDNPTILPDNHTIISGGTDGIVRSWTNPHFVDGVLKPDDNARDGTDSCWKASADTLASVVAHPMMGSRLLATCSGSRHFEAVGDDSGSEDEAHNDSGRPRDFSLKVWAFA